MKAKPPKARQKQPADPHPVKLSDEDKGYGLGTDIANLFAGIGFRPGEEIKEWKGFPVKDPFDS
jgi:hypothetical protein